MSTEQFQDEINSKRFKFGENWKIFYQRLTKSV